METEDKAAGGVDAGRQPQPERFLELGLVSSRDWAEAELGAVLEYHLSAPLEYDLGALDRRAGERLRARASDDGLLVRSLHDLFAHPLPPLEFLNMTKDFAKSCLEAGEAPLPRPAAAVVYYLSIGTALARLGKRISTLPDPALREGLDWALAQPWVDAESKGLLGAARRALSEEEP